MATKRHDLGELARLVNKKPAKGAKRATKAADVPAGMVTTGLHIRKEHLTLLRRAAVGRADMQGGRSSVSAILGDLIEAHRDWLERVAASK